MKLSAVIASLAMVDATSVLNRRAPQSSIEEDIKEKLAIELAHLATEKDRLYCNKYFDNMYVNSHGIAIITNCMILDLY
jgi:hypothetical protein